MLKINCSLRGVIPNNIKEDALKCSTARIIDYIKKEFKAEAKVGLKLPLSVQDWSPEVVKNVCKQIR